MNAQDGQSFRNTVELDWSMREASPEPWIAILGRRFFASALVRPRVGEQTAFACPPLVPHSVELSLGRKSLNEQRLRLTNRLPPLSIES